MSEAAFHPAHVPAATPVPIPLREILPWALFAGLMLLLAL